MPKPIKFNMTYRNSRNEVKNYTVVPIELRGQSFTGYVFSCRGGNTKCGIRQFRNDGIVNIW